jgi:hypothetical protein
VHPVVQMRDGEPVRRIEAGLRGGECPEPHARVWPCDLGQCGLDGGKQSEQHQGTS